MLQMKSCMQSGPKEILEDSTWKVKAYPHCHSLQTFQANHRSVVHHVGTPFHCLFFFPIVSNENRIFKVLCTKWSLDRKPSFTLLPRTKGGADKACFLFWGRFKVERSPGQKSHRLTKMPHAWEEKEREGVEGLPKAHQSGPEHNP